MIIMKENRREELSIIIVPRWKEGSISKKKGDLGCQETTDLEEERKDTSSKT